MNDFFADFNCAAERDPAYDIAQECVDDCERFDRTVCQFANKYGEAQPVLPHERAASMRFARDRVARAVREWRARGGDETLLRDMIRKMPSSLPRLPQGPIQ